MVEFLTLFLGLVTGPQVVALSADPAVAAVEIRLDGAAVASASAPVWKAKVDLGPEIAPRLLEAVARDAAGAEIGRAAQRVNVPRPPAEARLRLERDASGRPSAALLAWESSLRGRPLRHRVLLDGEEIAAPMLERVVLPPLDAGLHFLQAELGFSNDVIAYAQLVFGGEYLEEIGSELTALPVVPRWKGEAPEPAQMRGWFTAGGAPVRVAAVEKGPAELVIVRGPGVPGMLVEVGGGTTGGLSAGIGAAGVSGVSAIPSIAGTAGAGEQERLRQVLAFDTDQRIRLLMPRARQTRGHGVEMESFAMSPEIRADQGGMYWALKQDVVLPGLSDEIRVSDAVAVAALQAAGANRRRAVLLVLGEPFEEASRHPARAVRGLLESLDVPLIVWRLAGGEGAAGEVAPEWGEGEAIGTHRDLQKAARRLEKTLDRQRIVWVEGSYLPSAITATASARVAGVSDD